jgi:hypothetical protein
LKYGARGVGDVDERDDYDDVGCCDGSDLNTGLILDGARPGVDGDGATVGGGAARAAPLSRLHASHSLAIYILSYRHIGAC